MNAVSPKPISLITVFGLPTVPSPTICGVSEGCGGLLQSAFRMPEGLTLRDRLRTALAGSPISTDRIEFTLFICTDERCYGLAVLVPLLPTPCFHDAVTVQCRTIYHRTEADFHRFDQPPSQAHGRGPSRPAAYRPEPRSGTFHTLVLVTRCARGPGALRVRRFMESRVQAVSCGAALESSPRRELWGSTLNGRAAERRKNRCFPCKCPRYLESFGKICHPSPHGRFRRRSIPTLRTSMTRFLKAVVHGPVLRWRGHIRPVICSAQAAAARSPRNFE